MEEERERDKERKRAILTLHRERHFIKVSFVWLVDF